MSVVLLASAFLPGCARKVPGDTFPAGYILSEKHSKVTHDFVVTNTTSEPVKITKIEKSCTCTSFELGKYRLAAGESTTFSIDVDVTRTYMQKSATCVLVTDHPTFKNWSYTVRFVSLPFVVATPSDLNLGCFAVDGKNLNLDQRVTLDLFADSKIELTRANFTVPEEIELSISSNPEVRRLQRDVWNTRYQVSVGLSPEGRETILRGSQPGLITRTIGLAAGDSESRLSQYSVYWQALPPLESHPSYVSFGNLLDEKDNHCRRIVISSTTNEKFRIVSIASRPRDIRIESTDESAGESPRHQVMFKVTGPKDAESRSTIGPTRFMSGTIRVQTTDNRRPVVEIPWSAMLDSSVKLRSRADQPKSSSEPGL